MSRLFTPSLVLSLSLALLAGCTATAPSNPASNTSSTGSTAKLNVVTTVAPLTNIAYNVAGSQVNLTGIIGDGIDSHTFEPAPSDAKILGAADIIFVNGLHLEEPTVKLAEANKKPGAKIVYLGENTITEKEWIFDFSFPKDGGDPNPHLWMNPLYAKRYAEIMRDELKLLDPAHKEIYQENTGKFVQKIEKLDQAIQASIQTIPEKNRKLLTYHDSFAYFAPRYGMSVIGAIQPSDFNEPTPQDVVRVIEQIRSENLPAVFGSEVFPSKIIDQIAKEAGVTFIETLSDDALPGQKGDANHTYVGMMVDDVRTMSTALGGNATVLDGFDVTNVSK